MRTHSVTCLIASIAAGAIVALGSADASAHVGAFTGHVNSSFTFLLNATVNEWSGDCTASYPTAADPSAPYEIRAKGACAVTLMIRHATGYDAADMWEIWSHESPTSLDYFTMIDDSPLVGGADPPAEKEYYFRQVDNIANIALGDIMSIRTTTTYAGHTMIIRGPATQITAKNPIYANTKQYQVPVYDSTSSTHGCKWDNAAWADSRWPGVDCNDGEFDQGFGSASIRIYTDLSGKLLGYSWAVAAGSTYNSPTSRPYRIGRLWNLPDDPVPPPEDPPPPPP